MARVRTRTAQQRDARELALTRPADPYRGALKDPFTPTRVAVPANDPAPTTASVRTATEPSAATADQPLAVSRPVRAGQPGGITLAGILGIVLGLGTGIFGLLLVTIVNLQDQYGAPDRSFYRGTDSGYIVLGLLDFGIAALCGVGGITLLTGRVLGRIALTVGGWACLILAAYWLEDSSVRWFVPIGVAVLAAAMLFGAYTRTATRWLGVLPTPQPE